MELNEKACDKIQELINIGVGKSANILNSIVKNRVYLNVPKIHIITPRNFTSQQMPFNSNLSTVSLSFMGELTGKANIAFPIDSAVKIVDLLTHSNHPREKMDQLRASALNEVGNIVLNSLIGTMANLLQIRFNYKIPIYQEQSHEQFQNSIYSINSNIILAETNFRVKENNIEGTFMLFFEMDSFDNLIDKLEIFN